MILVLNCGSQSIKYALFKDNFQLIEKKKIQIKNAKEYTVFLNKELERLKKYEKEIKRVGHRVVHGGKVFRDPVAITEKNLKDLEKYSDLAPLHNPYNLLGIKLSIRIFPRVKQIAVFDTGFYKDLPEKSFTYGLPENLRKKFGFRRYGFHGISHEYAARAGAKKIGKTGKKFENLKIITCHLGGGSSMAAIKNGKAVDTSMGFTPLEGLLMMTRGGDMDPGILLQLAGIFSERKMGEILNKQSGIKGICGLSDMKEVLRKNNEKTRLALEIFTYRIQKYIGSYFAVLGGCDLLVFTGAIGAGSEKIRKMILKDLDILKMTKVVSIEPNEELFIAQKLK